MTVTVRVTEGGELQVTSDGVTHPPLSVAAVQAMAGKLPEATEAASMRERSTALRVLADVMASPGTSGAIQFTDEAVTADVDAATFVMAREAFGVEPDVEGDLRAGSVVVRKKTANP